MKITIIIVLICIVSILLWKAHETRRSNHDPRTEAEMAQKTAAEHSVATFAGGCFWCSEADFEKTLGVIEVVSGYTGGTEESPQYKQVSSGTTGHREAVQVYYDASVVTYKELLDVFWRHTDPTDAGGTFADRGAQYTTAIYYHDAAQKDAAEKSKSTIAASGVFTKPIVTPIIQFEAFWPAEDYHQDYHKKNPRRYAYYRGASGRNQLSAEKWGEGALSQAQRHTEVATDFIKPPQDALRAQLSEIAYNVTQEDATEKPFDNPYWDHHEAGIYVDVVSGEPLYSSRDKFDSGTGWPSFLKPIAPSAITQHDDYKLFQKRIEVRSAIADSHLGHILMDGPAENDHVRHCINSAALRFVPVEDLTAEGYDEYAELFSEKRS